MRTPKLIFILQAFFAIFLWAASRIILKESLVYASPYLLAGLVQLVAFIFLLILFTLKYPRPKMPSEPSTLFSLALISLVGFAGAPLFVIVGLQYASGILAGLLAGLNAVLVLLIGAAVLGERPQSFQRAGILVAIFGALLFITSLPTGAMFFGIILLLIAELGFALTTVLMRSIIVKHTIDPLLISLVGSGIGTVVLLPLGLFISGLPVFSYVLIMAVSVLGFIFAFASSFWYDALKYLRAFEASILSSTILIQIAVLSLIFLGESMTAQEVLGSALVFIGATIVELQPVGLKPHFYGT